MLLGSSKEDGRNSAKVEHNIVRDFHVQNRSMFHARNSAKTA
jgi:hypothetical protein